MKLKYNNKILSLILFLTLLHMWLPLTVTKALIEIIIKDAQTLKEEIEEDVGDELTT